MLLSNNWTVIRHELGTVNTRNMTATAIAIELPDCMSSCLLACLPISTSVYPFVYLSLHLFYCLSWDECPPYSTVFHCTELNIQQLPKSLSPSRLVCLSDPYALISNVIISFQFIYNILAFNQYNFEPLVFPQSYLITNISLYSTPTFSQCTAPRSDCCVVFNIELASGKTFAPRATPD